MVRPLSQSAKHRRQYLIRCYDPHFYTEIYFMRSGYKSLLLAEFSKKFPFHDIYIYTYSGCILNSTK